MGPKGKKGKKGPPESGWMPGFGTKGITEKILCLIPRNRD